MKDVSTEKLDLEAELLPETGLEKEFLQNPFFTEGLLWGVPRFGHPEGEIYKHVKEVFSNIDRLAVSYSDRMRLRLIALAHDTFKFVEDKGSPRDWSKHHGVLARQFVEKYTDDQVILDIIELHDEAFYSWRTKFQYRRPEAGDHRLQRTLRRLNSNLQLYYLFFKCDTLTGDKILAPLRWFEEAVQEISVIRI